MCDQVQEIPASPYPGNESDDDSDSKLEIIINSPKLKRKIEPTEGEQQIIASIDQLERTLEEKAAKTNLNVVNVKNIIKHVVTNEHVLAMVRKAVNPSECVDDTLPFEPKLTRAKAKELLSTVPLPPVPWVQPKNKSKVVVLMGDELEEDSSEEDYKPGDRIPVEDESEEDQCSMFSDPSSIPPPTPPSPCSKEDVQTNWTEDGVFKIPPVKMKEEVLQVVEDEATIARRTRSKLSLNDVSLETIEERFVPPDLEAETEEVPPDRDTDLEEMDCDNEDWMDFLKKFALPLDEIAKATEDDEHDPEYNILADEEVDKVDKEELRVDKAVKVTRKELNNLIAELFECTDFNWSESTENKENNETLLYEEIVPINQTPQEEIVITEFQTLVLLQQMRQHVQILTQNFLLSYEHPEFHDLAPKCKEYLLNLKLLSEGKERSAFYTVNLSNAIQLIADWEALTIANGDNVKKMKFYVQKVIEESWRYKNSGTTYIPTFPSLILETIANSDVFLYPYLLPKIPFRSPSLYSKNVVSYTTTEDNLIAVGLEEFSIFVSENKKVINRKGEAQIKLVCAYIQEYLLPFKDANKIYKHVKQCKANKCGENPIKYYFRNKKAPNIIHFVTPLDQLQILPPCKRQPDELPYQWREFIYPKVETINIVKIIPTAPNGTIVSTASTGTIISTVPTTRSIPTTPTIFLQSPLNASHIVTVVSPYQPILPKTVNDSTVSILKKRKRKPQKRITSGSKNCSVNSNNVRQNIDPITKFINILTSPLDLRKLLRLLSGIENEYINNSTHIDNNDNSLLDSTDVNVSSSNLTENSCLNLSVGMLPSMPQLATPLKQQPPDSTIKSSTPIPNTNIPQLDFSMISSGSFQHENSTSEVEFCDNTIIPCVRTTSYNVKDQETVEDNAERERKEDNVDKENPEDMQNSSATSSTTRHTIRKEPSGAEKKKTKIKREFLANLSISTPEDSDVDRKKNEMFALKYYDKLRETMELEDYHKIIQILNDHEEGDAVELYQKVEPILRPKYEELGEEFLLFLRVKEAHAVNRLIPWIRINNRSRFLRKLETYFKDQPAQLKKIYTYLTELSQMVDVSMEKIKSTLLPMFKGNAVLSDLFLQDFMCEKPPPSLMEGQFEFVDVNKDPSRLEDMKQFEMITVPDVEDKYGGQTCICSCHEIEDPEFKSRCRHCIRCGTKFVNGKVFIQTGRGLKQATFSFLTSPETDHSIRLTGKPSSTSSNMKRRCDTSPFKQTGSSPTKENCDEESDYEGDSKKKTKKRSQKKYNKQTDKTTDDTKDCLKNSTPVKRSPRKTGSPSQKDMNKPVRKRAYSVQKSIEKKEEGKCEEAEEKMQFKPGSVVGQQKRFADELSDMEDNNQIGESSSDVKPTSPEQNTAESESEFCEESSQDNCESDSNSSMASDNTQSQSDSNADEGITWKREEDKIILEAFQKENDKKDAFKAIADKLKGRNINQIRRRFDTLIKLLMETIGKRTC